MTAPDYTEKIPNNVELREDRRLQRALESWQPNFLNWWESMGPTLPTQDVYLRTAVNVGREGWAHFGHVAMKDYRWGIFLAERNQDRRIAFGQHRASRPGRRCRASTAPTCSGCWSSRATPSRPAWSSSATWAPPRRPCTTCATCSRSTWRRGGTCGPWSTCCRPTSAAKAGMRPRSCCTATRAARLAPHPGRVQRGDPGLAVVLHVHLLHRPGRQVPARHAEGERVRPAVRTCEFMLKEEAHHMMVGTTGVDRVVSGPLRSWWRTTPTTWPRSGSSRCR